MKSIAAALLVLQAIAPTGDIASRPLLSRESRIAAVKVAGQSDSGPSLADPPGLADTLRLAQIQQAAVERDPRARQLALQESTTALRLLNLAAERLPAFAIRSQASHQSEVPAIANPSFAIPHPPKDRLEISLEAQQLIYDGGILESRRLVEEAELRAERARIAASLYPLRADVNEAFFKALLLQERDSEIAALIEDLDARLSLVRSQVQEGAALAGDTALVKAEMLRAMQTRLEAAADRKAALSVLGVFAGRPITEDEVLLLPDLPEDLVGRANTAAASSSTVRFLDWNYDHPQYQVFATQRERLAQQSLLIDARSRPQLSAFAQLAWGRPGFEQFTNDLHEYWMGGLRFSWQPWNWGTTRREREVISNQREIISTEEAAFTERLARQLQDDFETIRRLIASISMDDEIVLLTEQLERQATAQLAERAIPPAEYVDARTDLQEARLARQRHQIELAGAWVRYMTTLGSPIR